MSLGSTSSILHFHKAGRLTVVGNNLNPQQLVHEPGALRNKTKWCHIRVYKSQSFGGAYDLGLFAGVQQLKWYMRLKYFCCFCYFQQKLY